MNLLLLVVLLCTGVLLSEWLAAKTIDGSFQIAHCGSWLRPLTFWSRLLFAVGLAFVARWMGLRGWAYGAFLAFAAFVIAVSDEVTVFMLVHSSPNFCNSQWGV